MSTTIYLRDLINYPGVSKTASVDLTRLIPSGSDGDEKWVVFTSTTAYSDNTANTSIQNVYASNIKQGFSKSSGFVIGPYTITTSSNDQLTVTIDGVTADVTLAAGINLAGTAIAADIETKLKALAETGGSLVGNLSFLASNCSFSDGQFKITSGTFAEEYTGADRSSVEIPSSGTSTSTLGYDLPVESVTLAGRAIRETTLSSNYTAGSGTLSLSSVTDMEANSAYMITDGTSTDYFTALTVVSGSNQLTVPVTGSNGFDGISNSYTTGTGSKVQMLVEADSDPEPKSSVETIDDVTRQVILTIQRQIDFSS